MIFGVTIWVSWTNKIQWGFGSSYTYIMDISPFYVLYTCMQLLREKIFHIMSIIEQSAEIWHLETTIPSDSCESSKRSNRSRRTMKTSYFDHNCLMCVSASALERCNILWKSSRIFLVNHIFSFKQSEDAESKVKFGLVAVLIHLDCIKGKDIWQNKKIPSLRHDSRNNIIHDCSVAILFNGIGIQNTIK